ncbi:MAG: Cu+-exporting ATPase [Candidatus Azotimanducaceae bacterium]|jgi:Cu+-exporting ATPase
MKNKIDVFGMTCGKCEARVQDAVQQVLGVASAVADRVANQLEVAGDFELEAVHSAVLSAGYKLAPDVEIPGESGLSTTAELASYDLDTYLLNVTGMSCASCVRSVETALKLAPGVRSASVNYADSSAFVSTGSDLKSLIDAITAAGYGASLREDQDFISRDLSIRRQLLSSLIKSTVALSAGVLLMANMHFGLLPESQLFWLVAGLVVLGIMMLAGGRYFRGALTALKQKQTTMDTLIAVGTGTAWIYSMLVIVFPEMFPEESRHLFFEAALFVIGFVNLGKALEEFARGKTSLALQKLMDLAPGTATRVTGAGEELVLIGDVVVGDQLLVRSGETVPVDGVILSGHGAFDEHMLTGESMPVEKTRDSPVTGGTVSMDGVVTLRATQVGLDTVLARMVEAVKVAQNSKPRIAELTDQIAAIFVPAVILIAVAALTFWLWLMPDISHGITAFMSVLIVACPCAMGLAIPMSITVGVGRGASLGILVKNSDALQRASQIDTLILDKTGTLTIGKPIVTRVILADEHDRGDVASIAKSLEALSLHPLAVTVANYFSDAQASLVQNFETLPGGGVRGDIDGRLCLMGSLELVRNEGCQMMDLEKIPEGTLICIVRDNIVLAILMLDDEVRPEAKQMIAEIHTLGIRTVVLSGDRLSAVVGVARQLGIDDFHGEMSPTSKQTYIAQLQKEGHQVGMVGDGINDSLALSSADVGFAMADGIDIAIESADVALLSGDLLGLPRAIQLSRKVMVNIRQNLLAAFGYNIVLIPIAAGALYPWTGQLIDPAFAGLAMAASSVTVVANAIRLRFMA